MQTVFVLTRFNYKQTARPHTTAQHLRLHSDVCGQVISDYRSFTTRGRAVDRRNGRLQSAVALQS